MSVPRLRGSFAPATAPAAHQDLLVLLPSLGTTTELWDGVVAHLRDDASTAALRVLRVDLPGHGASPATRDPFTVTELGAAVLHVVDEAGGGSFHVAGVSLGGAVALELAVVQPARLLSLTLCCSGARIGTADGWVQRAAAVRATGTASLVAASAHRWFAPGFLERDGRAGSDTLDALRHVDDESYARCAEALVDFDRTGSVSSVAVPTLLVSGEHDEVTTPASMQQLAEELARATHATVASTSHLAVLEAPATVAALLRDHLSGSGADDDVHARGMSVRRAVLGDEHVDAAIAASTPQTAAFQDLVTRYAWGEVWSRPGLSRRERSIATLALLVAGGHEAELRMHVRAALRNGLEPEEITEVILHTALYAGLPSANAAMTVARDAFADAEGGPDGQDRRDG
ncbi:4-carboxymuconolactone decarboxylase [Cellulomonas humilata]|uniref:4-carboxymuconolactone decarboxylase n=1 Tax=Cellulomonas humilata TaxID=144055 RepID=A0A7Y6DWC5_9CELL|nr:4-carboxymuconolactone decarboxylase [Cellulomonas humilata]NUU15774.1 4-carboxymuconolactone decarboxylase [Cellulomonas humilata]